jgi:hypothetical protein
VDYDAGQRLKSTEHYVVSNPDHQHPTGQVAPTEKKHSAKNCDQPEKTDPNKIDAKWMWGSEFVGVVHKADSSGNYEQPTNNRY